jgi:hypothetical protein
MAFASTVSIKTVMGNKRVHFGTWTTDTTGGNIDTGLGVCEGIVLQTTGSAVSADQCTVNETLPIAGSAITIVVTSGADGNWIAWGH